MSVIDGSFGRPSVYGVDYDTHRVAVCMLDLREDRAKFETVTFRHGKQDAFQAARSVGAAVERLAFRGPGVWWIEHAFGRGPVDFQLGRVQGAILQAIDRNAACNECPPSEWKKGVGLNGNAKKADYLPRLAEMAAAFVDFADALTEHELDAFGVALYGRIKNRAAVGS